MLNIGYDIFSGSKNVFLYIQRTGDPNQNYYFVINNFTDIVNKHAPLSSFMNRNIRKEFYTRRRFRNKFCKNPNKENEKLCKKQKKMRCPGRKCIK